MTLNTGTDYLLSIVHTTTDPMGCSWCGIPSRDHMQRYKPPVGWHKWAAPTQEQILARMLARRTARLTANPAVYHATTGWDPEPDGESAVPCCADCAGVCFRWLRIQARLERQRWEAQPLKAGKSGSWGGDDPWPF